MSIKASVHQVDSFSSSVNELQNSFGNGIAMALRACDILEKSIQNFIEGIQKVVSQISSDISEAQYILGNNETIYYRCQSSLEYAQKRLPQVQDEADIKRYQKTIQDCNYKMGLISQKNATLNAIINNLREFQNKYLELQRAMPSVEQTITPIRNNLDKLKSEHWSFCSKYTNVASTAQKLIAKIDENLSYVAEVTPSNGRVVCVSNAHSLTDMAYSLKAVSNAILDQNGGLSGDMSVFSSVIQDEVSRNALESCRESAHSVETVIDNFEELAKHFERAAKYLAEYEKLV